MALTQSWTRNLVHRLSLIVVNVVVNAGVLLVIQLRADGTLRSRVSATADRNADACGIELCGTDIIGRMQGDNLVAEHIVAIFDGLWDRDVPRPIGLAKDIIGPSTSFAAANTKLQLAHLSNLEELQRGLVNGCAVAVAGRKVGDDGSVVRLWPCRPVQVNETACGDRGRGFLRVGGVDGADDVGAVDGAAVDWAQVGVPRRPADGTLVGYPGCNSRIVSRVVLVADGEGVDPTMSRDGGRTKQDRKKGRIGTHFEVSSSVESGQVCADCNMGTAWLFESSIAVKNGTYCNSKSVRDGLFGT